jgi:hypothetical protein
MDNTNLIKPREESFHFGHIKPVLLVALVLLGISWMKNPELFKFLSAGKTSATIANADAPRYYAYVAPAEFSQPMVAGTSTEPQGPSIINEDGSVTPIKDMGQVLGASTQNVVVSLTGIAVNEIPDGDQAIKKYFDDSQSIENSYINNADFETALLSGSQQQIDGQAQKLTDIKNNLLKLPVPHSLAKLHKLKIAQYAAGINILNNFTQADDNPELVGQYLDQFLKAQQDMDAENLAMQQKYNLNLGLIPQTGNQ